MSVLTFSDWIGTPFVAMMKVCEGNLRWKRRQEQWTAKSISIDVWVSVKLDLGSMRRTCEASDGSKMAMGIQVYGGVLHHIF
jgi:hypothetical protein